VSAPQFDLPQSDVISYTKADGSSKRQGAITFGPYADVAPFSVEPLEFHYVNNAPFAVGTSVEKKVDVGRWGSLRVDERYVVVRHSARVRVLRQRFYLVLFSMIIDEQRKISSEYQPAPMTMQ